MSEENNKILLKAVKEDLNRETGQGHDSEISTM